MIEVRERINILGVFIDHVNQSEAINKIEEFIQNQDSNLVVTPNAEMIIRAQQDKELKKILNSAQLSIPDGAGVVLASKLLKYNLEERVAGVDVVEELLARGNQKGYSFYFLGGKPGVAEEAKNKVKEKYPNLKIRTHHGYLNASLEAKVLDEIGQNRVDILLVGMGVPLQEKWLNKHLDLLNVAVGIGVGGSFDILAEKKTRAPKLMQKIHLEWLYRLAQEPERLGRMSSIPKFIYRIVQEKIRKLNKLK